MIDLHPDAGLDPGGQHGYLARGTAVSAIEDNYQMMADLAGCQ